MAHSTANKDRGRAGEQKAISYLEKKGYTLLSRNYRYKRGEIDLIMQDRLTLVFVEVKWRSGIGFGYPEEAIKPQQETKLKETAEAFLEEHQWKGPVRFDVVGIFKDEIQHFEDAII
jgi:putative endonuclease